MTNKPMLSVERDTVYALWVMLCNDPAIEKGSAYGDCRDELRALLNKPAKPVPDCIHGLERFEADDGVFVRLGDVIDMLANEKAAKHQGEPVAWTVRGPDGKIDPGYSTCFADEAASWPDTLIDGYVVSPLYAEQPAPVAVVMPELESALEEWWESDGQYCRAGGGSYEKTFAYHAYEAALAEVARLNGVKP